MGTVIRVSVSLKMDESSELYRDTIHPLREEKQLTEVLLHLLELYHENEEIAAQVKEKMTGDNVEFMGVLLDQFDRIAREHNKTSMAIEAIKDAVNTSKGRVFDFDMSNYNPSAEEIHNRGNEVLATLQLPLPNQAQIPGPQENSIESLTAQVNNLTKMMTQMLGNGLPPTFNAPTPSETDVVTNQEQPVYTQSVDNTVDNTIQSENIETPAVPTYPQIVDNTGDNIESTLSAPAEMPPMTGLVIPRTPQPHDGHQHQAVNMTAEEPVSRPASFGKLAQSVR